MCKIILPNYKVVTRPLILECRAFIFISFELQATQRKYWTNKLIKTNKQTGHLVKYCTFVEKNCILWNIFIFQIVLLFLTISDIGFIYNIWTNAIHFSIVRNPFSIMFLKRKQITFLYLIYLGDCEVRHIAQCSEY